MDDPNTRLTAIVQALGRGDPAAAGDLLPLVYEELRSLARARMARTPAGNTLQPTALVHEAYLRVAGDADPGWQNRGHFFGAAARAMRDILVEQARRKAGPKAGGGRERVPLDAADDQTPVYEAPGDMLALEEALSRLERQDERKARVVMLRTFAGLTHEQIAEVMGVSLPTVERDWRFARAWLQREMGGLSGA